jgi:NTE family protein
MARNDSPPPLRGVGIVLAGGDARGAYQAGSALALAEWLAAERIPVAAVAAAGVGAINAAVLCGGKNFLSGAQRLNELWRALGELPQSQLQLFRALPAIEVGALLSLLFAAGQTSTVPEVLRRAGHAAQSALPHETAGHLARGLVHFLQFDPQISIDPTLRDMFSSATAFTGRPGGIPLYVSAYPSDGAIMDGARFVLANISTIDTAPSRLLHVQSLPEDQRHDAILAAAAIPFLVDARDVQERRFSDGSLGGWRDQEGRVPARALCERVDLSRLYVLHCSDGSLWDRRASNLPPTVEFRPSTMLGTGNAVDDLMFADGPSIERRLRQGYDDARRSLAAIGDIEEPHKQALLAKGALRQGLDDLDRG